MPKAAAVIDSVGPFLRAMQRSGADESPSFLALLSKLPPAAAAPQGGSDGPEVAVLRLARQDPTTTAESLLRKSGLPLIVFARALQNLRDTGLLQLTDDGDLVTVQATALGRQLVQP